MQPLGMMLSLTVVLLVTWTLGGKHSFSGPKGRSWIVSATEHHIRGGDDSVCDKRKMDKMLNFHSLQVGRLTYCCSYVYTLIAYMFIQCVCVYMFIQLVIRNQSFLLAL